ncbi:pyoverdine-tailoring periplasmic protein PvdN [Plantactinospora mayteni]
MLRSGLAAGVGVGIGATVGPDAAHAGGEPSDATIHRRFNPGSWDSVRDQFRLSRKYLQFSAFVLASHPAGVRLAIEEHRRRLDVDPYAYGAFRNDMDRSTAIRARLGTYLGVAPGELALTDSTTMGLGTVYSGLVLRPGDEVLTLDRGFYGTDEALRVRALASGVKVRKIALFDQPERATAAGMVDRMLAEITPATRLLAVDWIQSSTGVMLPIRMMADALAELNARRDSADRVLLSVDGVQGVGVEDFSIADLGCDFFISGLHKWLFGPRGTGFVWASTENWDRVHPVVPSFSEAAILSWFFGRPWPGPPGDWNSPGGFHSFEHRWAVPAILDFHEAIGKARVAARTREQAAQLKAGLAELPGVTVKTPSDPTLSSALTCCSVDGYTSEQVVARLMEEFQIEATASEYTESFVRLGPSIVTTPDQVDRLVRALHRISRS